MNVVPDATGKPATADASKGDLQSSFASVIGATVAASAQSGDAKLVKAQNVDTKKTSSPESKKQSSPSSANDTVNAHPVAGESVPLIPVASVVPVIPQVYVMPVNQDARGTSTVVAGNSSTSEAAASGNSTGSVGTTQIAELATLPAIASVDSGSNIANNTASTSKSGSDVSAAQAAPAVSTSVPAIAAVSGNVNVAPQVQSVAPAALANLVANRAATVPPVDSSKTAVNQVGSTVVSSQAPSKLPDGSLQTQDVAPVSQAVAPTTPVASTTVAATPATAASTTAAQPVSSAKSAVQQMIPNIGSTPTVSAPTVDHSQRSNVAPVIVPGRQVFSSPISTIASVTRASFATPATPTAVAAPAATSTPVAAASSAITVAPVSATPASASAPAATSTPTTETTPAADGSSAALSATQQVTATSLAVSQQQPVMQSVSAPVTSTNAGSFKLPTAKSAAPAASTQGSVASKGRTLSTDQRSSRSADTTDDKQSSSDSDNGSFAARVVVPEVGAKEIVSNAKGVVDNTALAQTAQVAPVSTSANSAPTASAPVQDANAAAGTPLPQQANAVNSAPVAHALNSAQLIQSVHGSEMKLGMQSAEFGNISINTSLNRQTLSAQISMDHAALGHALSAHLSAIEEKLGSAYGVQAKVELRDTASNSPTSDSGNGQSRGDRRSQGGNNGTSSAVLQSPVNGLTSSNFTSTSASMAATSSRLDIRI